MIRRPYIVISVRDPGTKRAKIRQTLGLKGVLYLAFHDAEPSEGSTLPTNIHMMTRSHAQQIWRFVNKHDQEVSAIVCHCEQGMSRSPAIASALAMHLGESIDEILAFTQPNQYVFELVLTARKNRQ